jgi:hypothetical protein
MHMQFRIVGGSISFQIIQTAAIFFIVDLCRERMDRFRSIDEMKSKGVLVRPFC